MRTGNEMAEAIIRAAEAGEGLPDPGSPMGVVLHALADPAGESYDRRFAERLAGVRPDWFDGESIAERAAARRF